MSARFARLALALVVALTVAAGPAAADVKPLPRAQWPGSVAAAVSLILATLTTAQRSIVLGTSRENLFMLQGEWGEDIETLLGLNDGNRALREGACGAACTVDEATLRLMQAAWEALQHRCAARPASAPEPC